MTRGDEIIGSLDTALIELDKLRLEHYDDADVRAIVERIGSKTERFFKAAVWPGALPTDTFDGLINRLKSVGVNKSTRSDLHKIRDLYNDAKHNPFHPMRLKPATDAVTAARDAIQSLIGLKLGMTAAPVETTISRLLWVSGYDVYTAGVTEVYVSLPLPEEVFATHLDVVWIKGLAWDNLKADLISSGCFYYGSEHFTPEVYSHFSEGDFINAGVWDGDYRQLIRILSKYEDRPTAGKLLSDLRRDHMYIAVLSSIALSCVDIATTVQQPLSLEELVSATLTQADQVYAMPSERPWVVSTAQVLASMVVQLAFESWAQLTGPYWNLWNSKELIAHIKSPDDENPRYVIDEANRVVIV